MDNKLNYTEENEEREDGKLSYRTPIYLQLREIIRNRIEEGEYLPGTAIPSENKLAETYGINRLTVRNAVDTLVFREKVFLLLVINTKKTWMNMVGLLM